MPIASPMRTAVKHEEDGVTEAYRILGSVLTVGAALGMAWRARQHCAIQLETAQAWHELLGDMRHRVERSGEGLSELMRWVCADRLRCRTLIGRELTLQSARARVCMAEMCAAGAERLAGAGEASSELRGLACKLEEAVSTAQAIDCLERAQAVLQQSVKQLEERLAGECRVRITLWGCGSLCAVLMLW